MKRYDIDGYETEFNESPTGEWVQFDDHESALASERREREEERERLRAGAMEACAIGDELAKAHAIGEAALIRERLAALFSAPAAQGKPKEDGE